MRNKESKDSNLKAPMRILMVEDVPRDADLSARELRKAGIECEVRAVNTAKGMLRELCAFKPDIILSDYSMPQFTGMEALEISKKYAPDLPFIIVTASANEETAVECIKRGADDCVTKQHLIGLPYAVRNTIERKRLEIAERGAMEQIEQAARQWRTSFDAMQVAIAILDPEHKILRCNRAMRDFIGRPWDRIIGQMYIGLVYGCSETPEECPVVRASRSLKRESWQTSIRGRFYDVYAEPIIDKEKRLTGIIQILSDITASKEAERRLIESQKKLDTIYQSINDGILLAESETRRFIDANRAMCEMLGHSFEEMKALAVEDIHPVGDLPRIRALFESQLRGDVALGPDVPIKRKDGSVFPADINAVPLELDGKLHLLGVFRDITERKKAEDDLRRSETLLKNTQRISKVGGWEWDLIHKMMFWTEETYRIHDLEIPEHLPESGNLIARSLECYAEEDRSKVLSAFKHCLKRGIPYDLECRFTSHKGRQLWIRTTGEAVRKEGRIVRIYGHIQDISGIKKAEESLKERNRFIQAILDNLPIGLAVNDIDKGITSYVNNKFEEIYGWPREELRSVDQFFENVYPDPQYREEIRKRVQEDILSGRPDRMVWDSVKATTKKGESRFILAKNIPLYEQNLMISTVQDMTESRKLQEKLIQAQKLESIASLAGGIAHDFNNILSAVIGYAELVQSELPPESKAAGNIREVLVAGHRAKDLVGHILTFSRQVEHDRIPTAPHLIVKEALGLLKSILPASIEIRTNVVKDGMVLIDPTRLHQVIMNLCTNAYHAMRDTGGVLDVGVQKAVLGTKNKSDVPDLAPGEYVCLSVGDTGIGMTADVMARIFDPYFTTKPEGEGTGLGLATVHGIVRDCQGDISVSSDPGKGSVFRVYLPSISGSPDAQGNAADSPLPAGSEQIMFVDDEAPLANLGKQMLESLGYHVVARTSPLEALELIRNKPDAFDLLITDMNMPGMSGVELAVKTKGVRPDLPVILCTGFGYAIPEEATKPTGIREIVLKPLIRHDLAGVIRKALDRRQ
ncbi:MAG: PAS domain S-box protein [Acidobacteria bacterium]|nr:PAS domain S-box protein [Acidobacteriota bacterium]